MSQEHLTQVELIQRALENKWSALLEGIEDEYTRRTTAVLLENEAQKGDLLLENPANPNTTGTFSGGTANSTGFDWSAADGTATGNDISPFQQKLLPLVRRVHPNLIANNLVGVQAMTSPSSLVYYLKYRYTGLVDPATVVNGRVQDTATAKGQTQPGTEYANFIGNTWNIDPYYTSQTVFREGVAPSANLTADAEGWSGIGSATVTRAPFAQPVIENTVNQSVALSVSLEHSVDGTTIVDGFAVGTANAALNIAASDAAPTTVTYSGRIDALTGQVIITVSGGTIDGINATDALGDTVGSVTYDYNMEGNKQLPEIELQIESAPVVAETSKLRTKWSMEAAQDLRSQHNLDAEEEIVTLLANEVTAEIDRRIINDLIIGAQIRVDYDYSSPFLVGGIVGGLTGGNQTAASGTVPQGSFVPGSSTAGLAIPGVTSFDDRNKALFYQILEVSNQIYRQSLRGAGNWIVTSPEIAAKLESLLEFRPDGRTGSEYNMAIVYSGTLNGQFKVYKDPLFPKNLILVGYKGSTFMDAGYFYCPYIPLQLTPTVTDPETFNPVKGLITRYGKVFVENGGRMYGVIRVQNINAVGANQLPGADAVGTTPQVNGGDMRDALGQTDLI